ncbi:MAG: IS30 family transposase [Actinobacteria bacterium]|nr:IS30 family transposase [Actinomycetota bacterium]
MRGKVLTVEERDEILRGICESSSDHSIATGLGRNQSVISREITRNGGRDGYRVHAAQQRYETLKSRPKTRKLEDDERLHDAVAEKLRDDFSPEQISGRLKQDHPDDPVMRVSHETIYQALFLQARGELRTQLKLALRTGRARRVPRGSTRPKQARIAGMVNVSERPAEAGDRAVPGHWEGDLIIGKGGKSQIATLVERHSRVVMLARIPYDRCADRVAAILSWRIGELPEQLRRSLTWDQGVEMAGHAAFTVATNVPVFFCDPHSPWQRGSNENTNGLLRQYLPKGTDLSCYTQPELDEIAAKLNRRPRKTLGFKTPAEALDKALMEAADALTA